MLEASRQKNQRATSHWIHANILWPGIHEVLRGAKKSARKLQWFPLRANPAAPWNEATKRGRAVDDEGMRKGFMFGQVIMGFGASAGAWREHQSGSVGKKWEAKAKEHGKHAEVIREPLPTSQRA